VAKRVIVSGRVQGVGFRYAVARVARTHGVTGWVHNLPDGTVEAVLDGEPDAVDSVVRFCRTGPRGASVVAVDVSEIEAPNVAGFDVR
jgi:acylphosphatase